MTPAAGRGAGAWARRDPPPGRVPAPMMPVASPADRGIPLTRALPAGAGGAAPEPAPPA
jgi:hypothetical protein